MADLFLLSQSQMRRIEGFFPLSHGIARVDDRRIVSAILFVIKNGLRWRDAPPGYGPHKTIYNRFIRWSRLGVFNKIFAELARKGAKPERIMIDATHLKAHRTAASLLKKACSPTYRAHQRRPELQTSRRLRRLRPTARHAAERRSDERFQGRSPRVPAMPKARELLADKGYDADWFREALAKRKIAACIPSKSNRKVAIPHDAVLYRQRHKIENMFGRLKDWRRVHTRYDRCAHTYFSAICIAAAVIFWL